MLRCIRGLLTAVNSRSAFRPLLFHCRSRKICLSSSLLTASTANHPSVKKTSMTTGMMPEVGQAALRHGTSVGDTGLVYDDKLTSHFCAWNMEYTEKPDRIKECYRRIEELGLVNRCVDVPVRPATDEEIARCHSQKHMELLKETQFMSTEQLGSFSRSYDYVYFHKTVEENARLALGGCIDLVEKVVTGKLQNGIAVIRPPGHHAMAEEFSGYCYFNNVAVAAKVALEKHGLKRILILDWDVHHGQGTQFAFYDDPRVLFVSIHRYENGLEWPHLRESDFDYVGKGSGAGYNINIPLNEEGCDNSDYLSIFFNLLLPVVYGFQPELVLVSAGYDAAIGCPEGQMSVSPACFAHFVNLLKPLAGGKMALLLEGGYCLKTLSEAAALSLRALLGDPTPNIDPISQARTSVVDSVLNTIKMHRSLHPSLAFQDTATSEVKEKTHPWQSYCPPQHHEKLRTREGGPSDFPLLQECADLVPDETLAAITQEVDRLQRDTVIASTKHRLGLLHCQLNDGHPESNNQSVEDGPYEGLLSGCHRLSSTTAGSEVATALSAILEDTGAAREADDADYQDFLLNAAACVDRDFHVKRTLFLNLTAQSHSCFPAQVAKENGRSLLVSLGSITDTESDENTSLKPAPVNIPLNQSQFVDADVIAAVQQIVLPISYEFSPDLVMVCLGPLKEDGMTGGVGVSAACVGHVVALLQGLARGRLLLLVSPEAARQQTEVVSECMSVLQGFPCQGLTSCVPHKSTVEVIKNVQDKQKATWKTLQFREKLPTPIYVFDAEPGQKLSSSLP